MRLLTLPVLYCSLWVVQDNINEEQIRSSLARGQSNVSTIYMEFYSEIVRS